MTHQKNHIVAAIEGSGGGGGGGPAPEQPNDIASRAILKLLVLTGEGPIEGLPGSAGPAQSIYINDTALMNPDGTYNFANTSFDYRVGTPDQALIDGFGEAASYKPIGADLKSTAPVIQAVTELDVTAVKVVVTLPSGLMSQFSGTMYFAFVHVRFHRKLVSSGDWELCGDMIVQGKNDAPVQRQMRFTRPAGTGAWQFRATRITEDSVTSSTRNATQVTGYTEYTPVTHNYPNFALVALGVDAQAVNGQIPKIGILSKGLRIKVPSNYDPVLRAYSGMFWDGSWKYAHTDNPAWILYDLLTNPRYGLAATGQITEADINQYSFYDAALYSDGTVPVPISTEHPFGVEPRFTFNYPLSSRDEVFKTISLVAGSMHCTIVAANGQICLAQDRPAAPSLLITKANVSVGKDGERAPFAYKSTGRSERQNSFNITYQDRTDQFTPKITVVEDADEIFTRGLRTADIQALGTTTLTQAIRHGKWALYTSLNQTEIVNFAMGMNGADLLPGNLVSIWDEDYTDKEGGGRVLAATNTTVTLDRPTAIGIGAKIQVMLADGRTIQERAIQNPPGTYTTLEVFPPFSQAVLSDADYHVFSAIQPRQFRITSAMSNDDGDIEFEAVFHDPNKYNFIELGISTPAPAYSGASPTRTSAVQDLAARESVLNDNGSLIRSIVVSWAPPAQGIAGFYRTSYRRVGEGWEAVETQATSYTIPGVVPGDYEIMVVAVSAIYNIAGPASTFLLDINTDGGASSPLLPVTELKEASTSSTTQFLGRDLNVSWRNPAGQSNLVALRDFKVTVVDAASSNILRVEYVPGVPPGSVQQYTYSYTANLADATGPHRALTIRVQARDSSNNLSLNTQATFTNPPPAAVTNFSVTSGVGKVFVTHTRSTATDYVGVLIWRGSSAGFAPAAAALVFQGDATFFTDESAAPGTTYYYKIAAYDDFGFLPNGSDLNVSAAKSGKAENYPGVPGGTAFPTGAQEGDSFYRSDEGKLYFYRSGAWTAVGVTSGTSLPASGQEGDTFILKPSNVLYVRQSGQWRGIGPADGSITTDKLASNAVTTVKLAASAVTANELAADSVIAGKLATNSVATANLQAGAATVDKLAANSVTAPKIASEAVTTDKLSANAVTTVKLAANSVSADKMNVTALSAITANMGYVTTGRFDLHYGDDGGWGFIRSASKWYRDGVPGFAFAREPAGSNFVSIDSGPSSFWMHSNGEAGLQFPGILMTNGGLTISQLSVIGRDQAAHGATCVAAGSWVGARQYATGWATYAAAAVYMPYGGYLMFNLSAMIIGEATTSGGGESSEPITYPQPTYIRLLINGTAFSSWDNVSDSSKYGKLMPWAGTYGLNVGPGTFTGYLQFYFGGSAVTSSVGVYQSSIQMIGSAR